MAIGCTLLQKSRPQPPEKTKIIIVGCSAAGSKAAKELLKQASHAKIICLSEEPTPAYEKPSMADVVSGEETFSDIRLADSDDNYAKLIRLNSKVTAIDAKNKTVTTSQGEMLPYDKLLLATGRAPFLPNELAGARQLKHVYFYDTEADVNGILSSLKNKHDPKIALVGAGIRMLELGDALKKRFAKIEISIINRSAKFLGDQGTDNSDQIIRDALQNHGLKLLMPDFVSNLSQVEDKVFLTLQSKQSLVVDAVVFALGTSPNSQLAKDAGLKLYPDGSIWVDEYLQTSESSIYAAGDVLGYFDPVLGRVTSSGKWKEAKNQGKIAAKNILGFREKYQPTPSAYISRFFGLNMFVGGQLRLKPNEKVVSTSQSSESNLAFFLADNKIKAFSMVWNNKAKSLNKLRVRRAYINQSEVSREELTPKALSGRFSKFRDFVVTFF